MIVTGVTSNKDDAGNVTSESYRMTCVGGDKVSKEGYPQDGVDEDSSFARWSPSGNFEISCINPALFGKIKEGERYFLDFTLANPAPETQ